jgi:CheY-like chemotaxis protein
MHQESGPRMGPITQPVVKASSQNTALVVGADPELAAQVSVTLPKWNVDRVADNLAALALVEKRQFDLVITGENTSGAADVELLRKIRRVRPHTRIIILTTKVRQLTSSLPCASAHSAIFQLHFHRVHSPK